MRARNLIWPTLLLAPLTAISQEAAPEGADSRHQLEEVVVTAARRETSLQDTPIAVSALSAATLADLQISRMGDIQKAVPGFKMLDGVTSPTNMSIALRGHIQQDSALGVAESPVAFYVDDIYLARLNGANQELLDLERIEVLRGPQGTLYGRNALAGAVKLVSRTPGDTPWFNAEAGYGSYGAYKFGASVGGPLSAGLVAGSLSVLATGTDGFYENLATNDDFGRERNMAFRGKLHVTPSEDFTATLSASYFRNKNQASVMLPAIVPATPRFDVSEVQLLLGDYTLSVPVTPGLPPPLESFPRGETEQYIIGLDMSYEFDWATLRSISGYVDTDDYFNVDFSGLGIPLFFSASQLNAKQFTQELQLLGEGFDGRLTWIGGAYYFREEIDQLLALLSKQGYAAETESLALFWQGTWGFTERLSATAGVRWMEDRKSFDGYIEQLMIPYSPTSTSLRNTYSQVTPKLGLEYALPDPSAGSVDDLLLYASAARGFKSGGYNGIPIFSAATQATPYGPEKNWTYEIGVKSEMLDRRMRLNAAYFLNNTEGLTAIGQFTDPNNPDPNTNQYFPQTNAGNARIQGLELEASLVPTDDLTLFANATFQSAKYTKILPDSALEDLVTTYGVAYVPQVPDYSFTVGFNYGIDVPAWGQGTKFRVGMDWFRTDSFWAAVDNNSRINAYSRINGFVGAEFGGHWTARASVSNLQDDRQLYYGFLQPFNSFKMLPPRQYMVTVRYDF